ncbi:MAG: T9SS type A sorting domain-containing protein, partial [Bacteroidota bacterium]
QQYVSVYPNPTSDLINIHISNEISGNANLVITDMSGKMVLNSTIVNSEVTLNSSDFNSGLYFVTVIGDNFRETKKLVIR